MNSSYQTTGLQVGEIFDSNQGRKFLVSVLEILTSSVVGNLPLYFHDVHSIPLAQV